MGEHKVPSIESADDLYWQLEHCHGLCCDTHDRLAAIELIEQDRAAQRADERARVISELERYHDQEYESLKQGYSNPYGAYEMAWLDGLNAAECHLRAVEAAESAQADARRGGD